MVGGRSENIEMKIITAVSGIPPAKPADYYFGQRCSVYCSNVPLIFFFSGIIIMRYKFCKEGMTNA